MKHKSIALFALSAALLLSACNTDKAVTTTSDATAITEEVTTVAAEATTTAATTTTDSVTAVSSKAATDETTAVTDITTTEQHDPVSEENDVEPFRVQFLDIMDVPPEPYSGNDLWLYLTAGGRAYKQCYTGGETITAKNFISEMTGILKNRVYFDELKNALEPLCTEGALDLEKLGKLPQTETFPIFENKELYLQTHEPDTGYLLEGKILILTRPYFDDIGIDIYIYDAGNSVYAGIVDTLWENNSKFPYIDVIARTDLKRDTSQEYNYTNAEFVLEIVGSENELAAVRSVLAESGADISGCRFLTQDEIRAEWLPVERLEGSAHGKWTEYYGCLYCSFDDRAYRSVRSNVAFDDKEFLEWADTVCDDDTMEKLKSIVDGRSTDSGLPKIAIYEPTDPVKLSFRSYEDNSNLFGEKCYRISENAIASVTRDATGRIMGYNGYIYDERMDKICEYVRTFRMFPEINTVEYQYKVKALEILFPASGEPYLNVITDKDSVSGIERFLRYGEPISKLDIIQFSEQPTETVSWEEAWNIINY